MAFIPIGPAGAIGLILDRDAHTLVPHAWSAVKNMRMNDGSAQKFLGHDAPYGTPSVAPYELFYVPDINNFYWLYAGLEKVYVTDGTTHTNLTRVIAAPGACTAALAGLGAGNLDTGVNYSYKITFVNADGETEAGTASNTVAPTGGDGQVALTSIPTGPTGVTARKVYRTEGGGATYKLLDTIADNVTTTYADNTADGSLGANAPSTNDADSNYSADADIGWSGGVLSGIPILNNGVDTPQMWTPVGTGQRLQELSNWPASTTCKVIRPFGNFLFGLDWTISGTRYPYLVRWSHPADPGAVPVSWDVTDATKDTGQFDLGETPDIFIDCLPLRGMLIVYKEKSAYRMQFVGGQFVFSRQEISKVDGIFSRRCAAEFRPGFHAVLTYNDFVAHNGVESESVIDGKNRSFLFESIDATYYKRTFVVHNEPFNEVWICYPEHGSELPNQALVWNYREGSWGHRELSPGFASLKFGVVNPAEDDTWNSGPDIDWQDAAGDGVERWNQARAAPTAYRLFGAVPSGPDLYRMDETYQFDGVNYESYVERVDLSVAEVRPDGSLTSNQESWKFLRGVRPHLEANQGTEITVGLAVAPSLNMPYTWEQKTFVAQGDYKVDATLSGRMMGVRFTSDVANFWKLTSFDLDLDHESDY